MTTSTKAPPSPQGPREAPPEAVRTVSPLSRLAPLLRWELLLLVLLGAVVIYDAHLSPYFLITNNVLDDTSNFMEVGILALPMTLIIISGNIDLSVGSNAAMCSIVFATLWQHGANVWLACLAALFLGLMAGLFNGLITTKMQIPSLVVTLGTYALYRGVANGLLGSQGIAGFPLDFAGIDQRYLPFTHIPAPLVIFMALAVIMAFLLNGTVFGRYIFAIGNNAEASRFSGVAVDRVILTLFGVSGLMAALAGLILTSRLQTATNTTALGFELTAITAAVLGGANIFGGEGSILGTVLAIFIIGLLQVGLTLANITSDIQTVAVGVMLICAILVPGTWRRLRSSRATRKGGETAQPVASS